MKDKHLILIVDDNQQNLQMLGALLEGEGYAVIRADNGPEALLSAKAHPPDLILLDILIPGMDGYEICKRIKKDPMLQSIPVIFLSGLGIMDHKVRAFHEGAVDYIDKPFHAAEILVRVRTHLQLAHISELRREIEERKRMEEALKKSETKYRRLYDSMMDAFASTDMGGLIQDTNRTFREFVGYTEEELCTLTFTELTPEKWHAFEADIIQTQVFQRGYSEVYEKEYRRKDGSVIPVEMRTFLTRDERGEPAGMWAIVRDISERIKLQNEAIRSAHLASVGELAAGVAHEINNPINVILLKAQVVARKHCESEAGKTHLSEIVRECHRISGIVSSLLSFSRPGEDTLVSSSIHDLLSETLAVTEHLFRKDSIEVRVEAASEAVPRILVNPKQIEQVFVNILINARYALSSRGKDIQENKVLHIKMGSVTIEGKQFSSIEFHDNGVGMSRTVLQKATNPFFTTKAEHGGTGLGLSISLGIITSHGGKLSLESEEEKYTRVIIFLPAEAEAKHDA